MNDLERQKQIAAHDARNRQLLAALAAKGIDLQAIRQVDLYFWSNSESEARRLAAVLESRKYDTVGVDRSSGPGAAWSVKASILATPHDIAASGYSRALVGLAIDHDSQFDGWGTEV